MFKEVQVNPDAVIDLIKIRSWVWFRAMSKKIRFSYYEWIRSLVSVYRGHNVNESVYICIIM